MDLIYVPALSWAGSGLESRYEAVLREYHQELVPVTEFTSLSRENWDLPDPTLNPDERWRVVDHNGTVVPQLREYLDLELSPELGRRRLDEVQRFFHRFAPFFREHQYSGIQACLRHDIAWRNETFADWTRRQDFEVLHESAAHILGLYGNFPVGSSPACQVLMLLANKMPSILGPALVLASRQRDFELWQRESPLGPLHDTMLLWFAQIAIDMPSFMRRFRHGYGAFFASVVLRNRIDYRTNSRVSRLEPFEDPVSGRQRVRVHLTAPSSPSPMAAVVSTGASGVPKAAATTGAGASAVSALPSSEFEFDAVLVTGRPDQVHHILPESHPMTPLYGEVKRHSQAVARSHGVYGVAIVSFSVSPRAGFVAQPRFVLDHQKHSRAMYADRLSAVVNMMRVIKTTDEAILTVVFQTQHEAVGTAGERELLFAELALYGFRDLHVLKMVHYPNTPTRVPVEAVAAGWYDRAEAAQGQQQLFFVGETFSGHGVPTVFLHTRDWCVRTFGLGRGGMRGLAGDVDVDGDGDMDHVGLDLEGEPDPFQPLIVNVSARLADMGTQTYMAMLRRPLEAVRLGVHPVLLVESPHDTAMPPVAFIFCLVGAMTLLHLFQHSMVTRGVEWTKKKNVAIYCTEIVVSCVALAAIVDGCTELLRCSRGCS
ncbi:hypothetical protein ATCC90586_010787 [Pythium insidiosum]|nr:hypothetical protein ATCC90586_010787 [Pythium insidiosum]